MPSMIIKRGVCDCEIKYACSFAIRSITAFIEIIWLIIRSMGSQQLHKIDLVFFVVVNLMQWVAK